jgi:hypothetical protein
MATTCFARRANAPSSSTPGSPNHLDEGLALVMNVPLGRRAKTPEWNAVMHFQPS